MFKCIRKCFVDRIYLEGEVVQADMSKNTNFENLNPVAEPEPELKESKRKPATN